MSCTPTPDVVISSAKNTLVGCLPACARLLIDQREKLAQGRCDLSPLIRGTDTFANRNDANPSYRSLRRKGIARCIRRGNFDNVLIHFWGGFVIELLALIFQHVCVFSTVRLKIYEETKRPRGKLDRDILRLKYDKF